jgi:hypothetical protein
MRTPNQSWNYFFIDNTINWLTFWLANKEFQKYDWKILKYNEICSLNQAGSWKNLQPDRFLGF